MKKGDPVQPDHQPSPHAPSEQVRFANLVLSGYWYAILLMLITLSVYLLNLRDPLVTPTRLSQLWSLPAQLYLQHIPLDPGWEWLRFCGKSDVLSLLGIALLIGLVPIGFLTLAVAHLRLHDWRQLSMALLQLALFGLAAGSVLF